MCAGRKVLKAKKLEPHFLRRRDGPSKKNFPPWLPSDMVTLSPGDLHTPAGRTQARHSGTEPEQDCDSPR